MKKIKKAEDLAFGKDECFFVVRKSKNKYLNGQKIQILFPNLED